MIVIHIFIFSYLLYLSIKLHGNNFLNTIALSVMIGVLSYLAPVLFYIYDNKYINFHVENGVLETNLLFYIESYFLVFILFTAKYIKIPSYSFNIYKSNLYPIIYIIFSIIKFLFGNFYLDVTNANSGNMYFTIMSILMGIFFILGLYTLATNRSKFTLPFILYYVIYAALSGSKGGIFFSFFFILIYYFQDKKIFTLKNLKYYLLIFIVMPPILYSVTAYRAEYAFQGDGKRTEFHDISNVEILSQISNRFNISDVYFYIIDRADHIAIMQMAYNQYNDDDFLLGSSYEIIPNAFLPSILFPDRVNVQDYYGTQLTEKVVGSKIGNTVIGLSPAVEAFINFSFLGFLVGALHGFIYNVLFQLLKNKNDNNFMIAYFSITFFIMSDTFLTTSLAFMIKDLIFLVVFISFINVFTSKKVFRKCYHRK